MTRREELSDEQWAAIEAHLPKAIVREDGKGRPRRSDRFPPYQTCHRRFQEGVKSGALVEALEALVQDLKDQGQFDLRECYIDATFIVAKKGGPESEKPSGARVRSSWQWLSSD